MEEEEEEEDQQKCYGTHLLKMWTEKCDGKKREEKNEKMLNTY
jgi:hypothetical protein